MEKKDLICRAANPDDRRSFLLELTRATTTLFRKALRRVNGVFTRPLDGFSEAMVVEPKTSHEHILVDVARMK